MQNVKTLRISRDFRNVKICFGMSELDIKTYSSLTRIGHGGGDAKPLDKLKMIENINFDEYGC